MSVNLHCTMYCRLSEQLSKSIKVGMEDKTAPHTESTNYLSISTNEKQEPICVDQSELVIRLPQQPMRSAHQIMAKQRKSSKQTCQGYRKIFLYAYSGCTFKTRTTMQSETLGLHVLELAVSSLSRFISYVTEVSKIF